MSALWRRPVCLVNASVVAGEECASSIRFSSRILSVGEPPRRGDVVVDLSGALVLPGLINAHDHLDLNHFGRLKFRASYENAAQWIDDMRPRLRDDPAIRRARAHSLSDRLWIGALKNLLSGVTTVSHHNPLYRELRRRFPIRVVRRYGWAHSFFLQGEPVGARGEPGPDVSRAYRATPPGAPFVVHIAEGVDARARGELGRLDERGCLGPNTVLVHGVGIAPEQWPRVHRRGAGLVWCPSSNHFLLGRSAPVRAFLDHEPTSGPRICLGTDSRLSGARDLLDELRFAHAATRVTPSELLHMVTTTPARLLRLPHAGRLVPGVPADLVVIPRLGDDPATSLLATPRSQLHLVVVGGQPLVGDLDSSPVFAARRVRPHRGRLDGVDRLFDAALARRVAEASIREPGLGIDG